MEGIENGDLSHLGLQTPCIGVIRESFIPEGPRHLRPTKLVSGVGY